jgi:hypothetical protein
VLSGSPDRQGNSGQLDTEIRKRASVSPAAAIEEYIHFYNYNRRQKKLKCLSPKSYRQLLENAA